MYLLGVTEPRPYIPHNLHCTGGTKVCISCVDQGPNVQNSQLKGRPHNICSTGVMFTSTGVLGEVEVRDLIGTTPRLISRRQLLNR